MPLNSNAVHNIINAGNVVLAAGTAGLIASGCDASATGALDCSHSFISPTYTAAAIGVLCLLKLGINIARDGFAGLFAKQPPVQK